MKRCRSPTSCRVRGAAANRGCRITTLFNEVADWNHSAEDRQNFEGPKSANYDGIEIPIEWNLAYHH